MRHCCHILARIDDEKELVISLFWNFFILTENWIFHFSQISSLKSLKLGPTELKKKSINLIHTHNSLNRYISPLKTAKSRIKFVEFYFAVLRQRCPAATLKIDITLNSGTRAADFDLKWELRLRIWTLSRTSRGRVRKMLNSRALKWAENH